MTHDELADTGDETFHTCQNATLPLINRLKKEIKKSRDITSKKGVFLFFVFLRQQSSNYKLYREEKTKKKRVFFRSFGGGK